jgi:hypothetical protein
MRKRPRVGEVQLALPGADAPASATAPPAAPAAEPITKPEVRAAAAPLPLALAEVAGFRATWLARLPEATTVRVRLDVAPPMRWYVTTGRELYTALRTAGEVVLTASELNALTVAAQYDRASRPWLADWLARKRADAGLMLDVQSALGDVAPDGIEPELGDDERTLGRVLRAYGCGLEAVAVGDGVGVTWLADVNEVAP